MHGLVKQAGGRPNKPTPSYDLGRPRSAADVLPSFTRSSGVSCACISARSRKLSPGAVRAAVAAVLANDAQHVSVLRSALGLPPLPSAFVTGRRVRAADRCGRRFPTRRQLLSRTLAAWGGGLCRGGARCRALRTSARARRRSQSATPKLIQGLLGRSCRLRRVRARPRHRAAVPSLGSAQRDGCSRTSARTPRRWQSELRDPGRASPRPRPPTPRRSSRSSPSTTSRARSSDLHHEHDCLDFLLDLENLMEGAYYQAMSKLTRPRLIALGAPDPGQRGPALRTARGAQAPQGLQPGGPVRLRRGALLTAPIEPCVRVASGAEARPERTRSPLTAKRAGDGGARRRCETPARRPSRGPRPGRARLRRPRLVDDVNRVLDQLP